MQITNYNSAYKPCFSAKFVNNVTDSKIVDTQGVSRIFEDLTKDSPDNMLVLTSLKEDNFTLNEKDLFELKDKDNKTLIKLKCDFHNHKDFKKDPKQQATLLHNIFSFLKARVSEFEELKRCQIQLQETSKEIKILSQKLDKLIDEQTKLVDKKDMLRAAHIQNMERDCKKYNIQVDGKNIKEVPNAALPVILDMLAQKPY